MALSGFTLCLLLACVILVFLPSVSAFGAGNIASQSIVEGENFRHGDIEDVLKHIPFLFGEKFKDRFIKRVYFGNWLRDYSQAVDVGSLKGVQKEPLRVIVWILSFMAFGYATGEFEVTEERLGTYQAHEHIDNPTGYPSDARSYDPRLRGPVQPAETAVDMNTAMKNYIANESGGWATSSGYIKYSIQRSIHFGRKYTNGGSNKGDENDLFEALRCLGQALHCLEDFAAHSNYVELALIDMGHSQVFPHVGSGTQINVAGKRLYPVTTGTFGGLDFVLSVLGEVSDQVIGAEASESNTALYDSIVPSIVSRGEVGEVSDALNRAVQESKTGKEANIGAIVQSLQNIPGAGGFADEAIGLQAMADDQIARNQQTQQQNVQSGIPAGAQNANIPGMNMSTQDLVKRLYPILLFHDKVVGTLSKLLDATHLKAPIEWVTERITLFVMALIAPFIQPIIKAVGKKLMSGNGAVVQSDKAAQELVWLNPTCSDPTHSKLSKDHFSNILNKPAGLVASQIVQYVAPRVIYAWEHSDIRADSMDQLYKEVVSVLHHPALRNENLEIHKRMFSVVREWAESRPGGFGELDHLLSSDSVRHGLNQIVNKDGTRGDQGAHSHGPFSFASNISKGLGSHSTVAGSPLAMFRAREIDTRDVGPTQQGVYDNSNLSPSYYPPGGPQVPQQSFFQTPSPGGEYQFSNPAQYQTNYQTRLGEQYQQGPPYGGQSMSPLQSPPGPPPLGTPYGGNQQYYGGHGSGY